jgi:AcrR family transcriptional regulator
MSNDPRKGQALYDMFLRKRPSQSRSRNVVESILIAALDRLSVETDEGSLSIQNVARRAGVGIGSVYDYFSDRKSLMSSLAAKVTEDNRAAFEQVVLNSRGRPLRASIEAIVDHAFVTYLSDTRVPRSVLRIAGGIGLMPLLFESQTAFAKLLATMLGERADVAVKDPESAASVLTSSLMGLIHALVWLDPGASARAQLREEFVSMSVAYLQAGVEHRNDPQG